MEGVVVTADQTVLLLWSGSSPTESLQQSVIDLQSRVSNGKVQLEHIERLQMANHQASSFDVAVYGLLEPSAALHDPEVLGEICRVLKPSGTFYVGEAVAGVESDEDKAALTSKLTSALKLSGFVNISQPSILPLSDDAKNKLAEKFKNQNVILTRITAQKPNYEVGASTQLKISFGQKKSEPANAPASGDVWTLSAMDMNDDDVELVDEDELLDEEDLKRPDPASLRVDCGSDANKKKKACKNCTCGLADELDAEAEQKNKPKVATSACGNCYLGDAFRCSSCPYLGMPAFKAGEKVALSDRQLKADR